MLINNGIRYEKTYKNQLKVLGFVAGYKTNQLIIPEYVQDKKVIEIAADAFANELCLESVSVPESIEFIGERAFYRCLKLKKVELTTTANFEEIVTLAIYKKAFENCLELQEFIGNGRTVTLMEEAFEDCYSLKNLDFKIQKIEALALYGCWDLGQISFATSGILKPNCLNNSKISELMFWGDGIIDKTVLEFITSNNIKIVCTNRSNLKYLAYNGYNIEIFTV